jgi:arsenate reductase-like glutaredoxin family protein
MYSSTTCTTCNGLGNWLNQNGFEYTKKMVDSNQDIMDEFLAVSDNIISVPFTVISDDKGHQTKILGYDRKAFKSALGML